MHFATFALTAAVFEWAVLMVLPVPVFEAAYHARVWHRWDRMVFLHGPVATNDR